MVFDRRSFIKTGGLSLALPGVFPAFLGSCPRQGSENVLFEDMTRDVQPLTNQDFAKRQEKVCALMAEGKIDALWIEGGTNLAYFFDVSWWISERVFGVLLPAHGDPVWICPGFEAPGRPN